MPWRSRYSSRRRAVARQLDARRRLLDDEAVGPRPARLDVLVVDAVVADHRVGHADDLPPVGGIGEDLLVPGHGGVEDDLARRSRRGAERLALGTRGRRAGRATRARSRPHVPHAAAHDASSTAAPAASSRRTACCGSGTEPRRLDRPLPSRSRIVTSAGAPGARLPPGRPRHARGAAAQPRDQGRQRSRAPGRTSRSSSTATAVSSPTIPLAAWSNSTSLSLSAWGAWSVAMQSMVPSASASQQRLDVALGPQRRRHLGVGVVGAQRLVGQEQVVRRHLGGDPARRAPWRRGRAGRRRPSTRGRCGRARPSARRAGCRARP